MRDSEPSSDIGRHLAWNLRRLRVERGLSQETLALEAGIDRTYVSRIERNLENPSLWVLQRLALVLGTEIGAFLVAPEEGAAAPLTLPSGRRPRRR